MSLPLLGICIPTYRRPEQLRRCVASILRSISLAKVAELPIHVTDDSCDDTNLAVIANLRAQYPQLVHHRNPENLGIDGNILHCVDVCPSRYAWIMGEDDRMTPEAIGVVLPVLERAPAFVYVNYASIDEDVSLVLAERSLPLEQDVEQEAAEFFARSAWSMGFIGACVVQKDRWNATPGTRYLGTWFAHAGRILESLRGLRAVLIARPLVLNRCGAPGAFSWSGSTFEVLNGWGRMVGLLRDVYPAEACARAAASFDRAHAIGTLTSFSYLRADEILNPDSWEKYLRHGPYPLRQRTIAWLISRAPSGVFRAVRRGLTALRRRSKRRISGY